MAEEEALCLVDVLPADDELEVLQEHLEKLHHQWADLARATPVQAPAESGEIDPWRLDRELKGHLEARRRWDEPFGQLLVLFQQIRGWRILGFGSFGHYCEEILGMSERNELNPFGDKDRSGQPCSPGHPDPANPLAYKFGPGDLNNPCDQWHYYSLHPGGANFCMGDASVRFLSYMTSPNVQRALATRNGQEVFDAPY